MRPLICLLILSGVVVAAYAQQLSLEPNTPANKPVPVVTFDFVFAGATPAHYSVAVESTGRAAYRSDDVGTEGTRESSAGTSFTQEFTISAPTRTRIFQLAEKANYFHGDFNYKKGRIANTGTKTLSYSEGPANSFAKPTNGIRNQTVYNYSENPAIQQLTTIFQNISGTLELGQRLAHERRFDKLGLDAELRRAEDMAHDGQLLELQAIAPTLRAVADDYNVMRIARERAGSLLKQAEVQGAMTPQVVPEPANH